MSLVRSVLGEWNPRYIVFARSHGRTPQQQTDHDNGNDAGFMGWVTDRWREWDIETGHTGPSHSPADHDAFDLWLEQ